MKTLRLIIGVLCAATITTVCHQWHMQGCGLYSLFAACAYYSVGFGVIYWFIADIIKDKQSKKYGHNNIR